MIKRISLLVTAALLVATMAMAGLAAPAFATNTCKDFTFEESGPPFGQQTDSCVKGSSETEVTKHGKGDPPTEANKDEQCVNKKGEVNGPPCPK